MHQGGIHIVSTSPLKTMGMAQMIGAALQPGMLIALTGGLGSGKTTFVKGLARGLDVPAAFDVTSPTYTLVNEYPGRIPLFHVDLYRLDGRADLSEIGLDGYALKTAVAAVEWAGNDLIGYGDDRLFVHQDITGELTRRIHLTAYGQRMIFLLNALEPF